MWRTARTSPTPWPARRSAARCCSCPKGDTVPQVVLDEVTRLAPPSMVVLGGPSGVSDAADAALHAAAGLPWP